MPEENFLEYYNRYKDLLDKSIPKDVLDRILKRANEETPQKGDAWEPSEDKDDAECPF